MIKRRAVSHVPRLVPAGERTTGQGGYLTTLHPEWRSQLRAQCRMFAGFPLRPRHYTAGTLVAGARTAPAARALSSPAA
jgi:hypothetical protein